MNYGIKPKPEDTLLPDRINGRIQEQNTGEDNR